jgi:hypothetical protein
MAGILKVDTIQNANADNIITQTNSTTLTIGASGDTVTLAAGATSSGFGRTGTVNWDTTAKTTGFTAVSGVGYFCNTTSAAFTVTLPSSPSAGDIIAVADYDGTAATNNITVGRNSSNINGDAADLIISKNYSAISFVYVDATAGWRSVDTSNIDNVTNPYIVATGGTITTCGDYKIHTFTGPGTFTVTNVGSPGATVDYLVVAGAGGGGLGCGSGAGGGAGGMRASATTYTNAGPSSPRTSGVSSLPVTATAYPITVGSGGSGGNGNTGVGANNGNPSIFSTITSTGGGKGGAGFGPAGRTGNPGGSGGGASRGAPFTAGTGNTPPVSPPQGSNGGTDSTNLAGGGGGGALAVGSNTSPAPTPSSGYGGNGGVGGGFPNAFGTSGQSSGGFYYFSGGGGGGSFICATNTLQPTSYAQGGLGGGGSGSLSPAPSAPNVQFGSAGTANTGGGGGGGGEGPASPYGSSDGDGGNGGSGIVVIRYQFQ